MLANYITYFKTLPPLLLLLLFSLVIDHPTLSAQTATFVSTTAANEIPKSLERKFRRDAARLALRLEAEQEDLRYLNIDITPANVEMMYSILTTIYVENETAKAIAKCNVHTFPNPSIEQFVIIYERDIEWAAPLLDGINETDSDEFNDLLDEYELIIDKHVPWDDTQDAITIRSKGPLNMAALANEFYNIEGVEEIDLGIPKAAGNDIVFTRLPDTWEIQYILRFGSFSGNGGKEHIWTFQAKDDGIVQFIEETGEPIPSWMRCSVEKEATLFVTATDR